MEKMLEHLNAASVGIIGGADGPTAIYISGRPWAGIAAAAGILAAAAAVLAARAWRKRH